MFDLCRFLFLMTFLDVLLVCRVWLFFGRHAQYHWGYSNIVYLSSFYGCANGFNHAVKTLEVCLICAGNEHLTPFGNGCLGVLGVEVRSKTCVLISRFINSILLRKRTFRQSLNMQVNNIYRFLMIYCRLNLLAKLIYIYIHICVCFYNKFETRICTPRFFRWRKCKRCWRRHPWSMEVSSPLVYFTGCPRCCWENGGILSNTWGFNQWNLGVHLEKWWHLGLAIPTNMMVLLWVWIERLRTFSSQRLIFRVHVNLGNGNMQ